MSWFGTRRPIASKTHAGCKIRSVSEHRQQNPLEFEDARRIVIDTVRSLNQKDANESVDLEEAHGRVLAEAALSDRDYPALQRSLRDGYAVDSRSLPGVLKIRGEIRAGEESQLELHSGEALEIMTGAPVPPGANAVVMIEHTKREGEPGLARVRIDQTAEPGQWVNPQGAEAKKGSVLIQRGTRLDGSHVAALAMVGCRSVKVFERPTIAILATGDEIVDLHEPVASHQIRNSNSYMLAALVCAAGGQATVLPVARDTKEALREKLELGLSHDMLLVSGGVSAGKYDLVKPTLREFGVKFQFERVRVQPGQPTAFGTLGDKVIFGLPGNPGSTLVTYQLFARAALELLAGQQEPILPLLSAAFEAPFKHKPGLTRFLPARLSPDGQHLRHVPWQGSSDIPALASANAFLVADHDREHWAAGDTIRVMPKP